MNKNNKKFTLMMPTKVVFIIKMPSVKMEIAWVSLATFNKEKEINEMILIKLTISTGRWNNWLIALELAE